ncbi:MAG: tRNA 2-thiocytidine biosynthesis protein TtcA [Firmicutes bacterium]|nr:tRNA 2-thiocytidine biosynthesis protein TtcA [Bacillota bacterium]MCL1954088.1 tRNA 2-thiocytidine biosynthesis protein TtcA [Bacillota bacterium]
MDKIDIGLIEKEILNQVVLEKPKKVRTKAQEIERSLNTTYRNTIFKPFVAGINEYDLIKDGDKIAVCISGGKDSMLMAMCFRQLLRHKQKNFEVVFLSMDPGYNQSNKEQVQRNLDLFEIEATIFNANIFEVTTTVDGSPCYLCARMRRGHLYNQAQQLGCNKIALGHHFDDAIETILMGILYNGRIQTMMPKIKSKNFDGIELIRPMYHVQEKAILNWVAYNDLHFIQCGCPLSEDCDDPKSSKRGEIKQLIKSLKKDNIAAPQNIFKSVYNVNLDAIIGYKIGDKQYGFLDRYDDIDSDV